MDLTVSIKPSSANINLNKIIGLMFPIFKKKKKIIKTKIIDLYDESFLMNQLQLSESEFYIFIDYINEHQETEKILLTKKPLKLLEFLMEKSEDFKNNFK